MNKLLVVNKPQNLTSRDVVNKLNKLYNYKKIGHTGTLDPLATGVLVCLFGRYTKLVDLITAYDKEYIAEIKLGIETDTGDVTGEVLKNESVNVTREEIVKCFKEFPSCYEQVVPKYSAVKIDGQRLYEYARRKEEVTLPKRKVNIYYIELISFKDNIIKFKTKVSKGTYIRSLISDLCYNLHTIGTMSSLIRTCQGTFKLEDAYTLDDISNGNYQFQTIKDFLPYPIVNVPEQIFKLVINGNPIPNEYGITDKVILYFNDQELAIYEVYQNQLKPYIMLYEK